jgi:metal-responsive CopG/Arc/MetJ family transcriptional regulator
MSRYNWDYVSLPKEMMTELDKYLASDEAKRLGIRSRAELLRFIVREFLNQKYHDVDYLNE